ncbi:nitrate ABC transporter inner membrane subunit [Enterobacter asburiae]|uniref:Nitrate ABC transporter inner membrane subunit n=1 Tax=Enterobacter asburiae TaxID=61645 RepID=A0A376F913_ENTAS|nr:nitrate ABC transporter inner membrane subunit [Enterobacter asburiae]
MPIRFIATGLTIWAFGWNVLASLQRVAVGFGLAALAGIPLGFLIGRFTFFSRMFGPLIALLRPVSPLAWLPIGLLLFQKAEPASSLDHFHLLHLADGDQHRRKAYTAFRRTTSTWPGCCSFPSGPSCAAFSSRRCCPRVLTGVRLSIGIAWLVIVAAEMLTGGLGIGFWIWNEWNNLNVENILIAIVIIGVVGLLLEQGLMLIARRFSWQEK